VTSAAAVEAHRPVGGARKRTGAVTMMIGDEAHAIMAQRQREADAYRRARVARDARTRHARQSRNQQLVSLRIRRLLITVARQEI
jgi:hypothetical protein